LTKKILHIEDEVLWELLRAGDDTAYEALYRRYFKILYSYGKRIFNDEDILNDAIQDLFVDIWRTRHLLNQAESVKFYLISSLRRRIHRSTKLNTLQVNEWENVHETLLPTEDSPEIDFTNQEDTVIQKQKLSQWLNQLPTRQHEAIVLRFFHDFSYAEIAQMLQIKEQTARNLVQKALIILRSLIILLIFMVL
jgi:RNA polymerase sigma-70 factor (ECF subfamily)